MKSQVANTLFPYLGYFVVGQIILICFAILLGGFLILRRIVRKQPFEAGADFNQERVAMEIDVEIARLNSLRRRIHAASASGDPVADLASSVLPSTGSGASASSQPSAHSPEIAAELIKFKETSSALANEIEKLRSDLKEKDEKLAKLSPSPSATPANPTGVSNEEIDKIKSKYVADNAELHKKLSRAERALSEYEIFEQDLSLGKKYKFENETLRKQVKADRQMNETDIENLFKAEAPIDGEHFFDGAFTNMLSPPETPPTKEAEKPSSVAIENNPKEAKAAPPAGIEGFELEKVKSEPTVKTAPDAEALAESAANDDKLIQEFQKILGDQNS